MPDIIAKSWTRFVTTNFCVKAEIMGAIHEFDFENHLISVRLPKADQADRDKKFDHVASVSSYRSDTNKPLMYLIAKVEVEIVVRESVSVPDEALSKPLKSDHFSEGQKTNADRICDQHSGLAERAFEYWLGIVRWVTDDALIGQPHISGIKSG